MLDWRLMVMSSNAHDKVRVECLRVGRRHVVAGGPSASQRKGNGYPGKRWFYAHINNIIVIKQITTF